jgi:hypothetical protein
MKKKPDQPGTGSGLDVETEQVFELLRTARAEYEGFLMTDETFGSPTFEVPRAEDYTWEKPLTIVFPR